MQTIFEFCISIESGAKKGNARNADWKCKEFILQ